MTYESWRISFQCSEQAARAAFADANRLHSANKLASGLIGKLCAEMQELQNANSLLREENERLKADAERYRWLRELAKSNSGITLAQAFFWNCGGSRKQLDMAIDAARGEK